MSACSFTLITVPPIVIPVPSLPGLGMISFSIGMPDPKLGSLGFSVLPIVFPVPSLPGLGAITLTIPGVNGLPGLGFSVLPVVIPVPSLPGLGMIGLPLPNCPLD